MGGSRIRGRSRGRDGPLTHHPRPRPPPQGLSRCYSQPPQTLFIHRPLFPLSLYGYLLEVREPADLRLGRFVYAHRAFATPEVDHEEPAQHVVDRDCFGVLLALVFCHSAGG